MGLIDGSHLRRLTGMSVGSSEVSIFCTFYVRCLQSFLFFDFFLNIHLVNNPNVQPHAPSAYPTDKISYAISWLSCSALVLSPRRFCLEWN
jgi:hypothetical protein